MTNYPELMNAFRLLREREKYFPILWGIKQIIIHIKLMGGGFIAKTLKMAQEFQNYNFFYRNLQIKEYTLLQTYNDLLMS